MDIEQKPRKFLSPIIAGIGLGIALLGMFVVTGHGLGAYGFYKRVDLWLSNVISSQWTQANAYLSTSLDKGHPLDVWVSWEVLGIAFGAFIGSIVARRFKFKIERGSGINITMRIGLAILGGALSGFGAALARGCTSGLGLSGAATLSVAAFLFLMGFFIAGLITARITRKVW
jgi:hypothetical protein